MGRDGALLIKAFEATSYAVLITDAQATILAANRAFTEITGYSAEDVIGQTPRILQSGRQDADFYETMWHALLTKGQWQGEIWNRRKDGEIYPEHLTINAVRSDEGEIVNFIAIFSDTADRKEQEERLSYLAYHDELTGLANRTQFFDRLDRAISLMRRQGGLLAVLVLDLDGFKAANDTFGHNAGDLLLGAVSKRLMDALRESDTVARMGGDEFAAVLPVVDSIKGTRSAAKRVLDELCRPFYLAGDQITIGASIGIALYPQDARTAVDLVKHADEAMYSVKKRGKRGFAFFGDIAAAAVPPRRKAG